MLWRTLLAFLAMPGVVAVAAPLWVGMRKMRPDHEFNVIGLLPGWSVCFWAPVLASYTASMFAVFHLRIVHGEEPWLARTHGREWDDYRARAPRWLS